MVKEGFFPGAVLSFYQKVLKNRSCMVFCDTYSAYSGYTHLLYSTCLIQLTGTGRSCGLVKWFCFFSLECLWLHEVTLVCTVSSNFCSCVYGGNVSKKRLFKVYKHEKWTVVINQKLDNKFGNSC